jgi:neural Wiskott-Aldrich syndrome protein
MRAAAPATRPNPHRHARSSPRPCAQPPPHPPPSRAPMPPNNRPRPAPIPAAMRAQPPPPNIRPRMPRSRAHIPSSFPHELLPPSRRVFLPGSDIPTPNVCPLPSPSTALPSVMAGFADAPPPTLTLSQPATKQLGFAGYSYGVVID